MLTNLRIRSTVPAGEPGIPENAEEWVVHTTGPIPEYYKRILREYQHEEPWRGWHFETRGTKADWHNELGELG